MSLIRSFVMAFSTYSRIPMPSVEWSDANRAYVLCFFPMIGIAVGLALWGWLSVCDRWAVGAVARGAIGALIPLWITGGIHMDGFMDTVDARASWQTKARRLEILKDSHVGAFAVIGCTGYVVGMAALLSEATADHAPALGACFVASRALSAWTLLRLPSARPQGMADRMVRTSHHRAIEISGAGYTIFCVGVWGIVLSWKAVGPLVAMVLCTGYYVRMANREFGGVTGDLAGWFVQVTEACLIAIIMVGGSVI